MGKRQSKLSGSAAKKQSKPSSSAGGADTPGSFVYNVIGDKIRIASPAAVGQANLPTTSILIAGGCSGNALQYIGPRLKTEGSYRITLVRVWLRAWVTAITRKPLQRFF